VDWGGQDERRTGPDVLNHKKIKRESDKIHKEMSYIGLRRGPKEALEGQTVKRS